MSRRPPDEVGECTPDAADDTGGTAALVESARRIVADGHQGHPASSVLPTVLSDVPVPTLLVDLIGGTVTYANRAAIALADQPLPVPVDQWGSAAGLTGVGGEPLASSRNPLSRLATGSPVAGDAVRMAAGDNRGGRLLWVTGFPLAHSLDVEQLALVVLHEVAEPSGEADQEATLAVLRDRAISATALSFTITHPHRADNPLAWVNPAFTRVTGWELEEVQGRNCRFLQGPATDRKAVEQLRDAIAAQTPATVTLLNYRKDGTSFWNQVSVSPVFDGEGRLVSYVGVQADVTERMEVESERERAYAAERIARRDNERARQRLGLLAEASTQLASTLDIDETLQRLADLAVPGLADWVVVILVDGTRRITRTVLRHRAGQESLLARYADLLPTAVTERSGTRRVLADGDPILVADANASPWRSSVTSPEMREVVSELGLASVMHVPLMARRRQILGTMTFVSGPSGRTYTDDDLDVAADLGRRAGLTIDNARLYQHEHRAAETLQRSLLPQIPDVDGLDHAVRYLPGDVSADVGGDFYELLPLPDGSYGVAAGDVVGHDIAAAATMGHLRGLLRAVSWTSADDGRVEPAGVLDRVDRLIQGLDVGSLATLLYGRLERPVRADGPWRLTYASAGHPPPMLCRPDGTVTVLEVANDVLLGVSEAPGRTSVSVEVPPGSTLVAFTDGLIERRGEDIDDGLARVGAALSATSTAGVETVADALLATAGDERHDDTAVIVIRILG